MSEVRIGGVTARFNEDGTLYLYQPDSNRALSAELADNLVTWLAEHSLQLEGVYVDEAPPRSVVLFDSRENLTPLADVAAEFGVDLNELADAERVETDENAALNETPAEPTLKELRAQAAKAGVSPAGSKAQITTRLAKHGH